MLGTQVHFGFAAITSPAILFKPYHFCAINNTLCLRTARTSVTNLRYLGIGLSFIEFGDKTAILANQI